MKKSSYKYLHKCRNEENFEKFKVAINDARS